MAEIFLSYASADRERARSLAAALEQFGWSVFWDQTTPVGADWRKHIEGELAKARCVVVAWSAASVTSQWVAEEAEEGKKRNILVPLLLDSVEPRFGFRGIQTLDLSTWNGKEQAEEIQRLGEGVGRLLDSRPLHRDQERDTAYLSISVAFGLLVLDYALAMYAIRVGWYFFVPLKDYLRSATVWPQLVAPLVALAPPAGSVLRSAIKSLRASSPRVRAAVIAGLFIVSLLLGAAAWRMTPRLEMQVVGQTIDAGEAGARYFRDLSGASIQADHLCEDPDEPRPGCDLPLPERGQHLRLAIRLGKNGIKSYRLRLEGDPSEVGFARVRAPESLAAAQEEGGVKSEGRLLEITRKLQATPPLSGTVEVRLLCRQFEGNLATEPVLRATLTAWEEGHDEERHISSCWSLAKGRAGDPCPPGSSRPVR